MSEETENEVVDIATSSPSLRSQRTRRSRRRSSDVIEVGFTETTNPPTRRRRRLESPPEPVESSIIDLTCTDDIVDLTTPSPETITEEVPPVQLIIDEESDDVDVSQNSGVSKALSCPICLEKFSKIIRNGDQMKSTVCGHIFCGSCISKAIFHTKKCPSCRKKLDNRKVHNIYLPL